MNTALDYVTSQPWMILPDYLELIVSIASQTRTPEETARGIAEAQGKRQDRAISPASLAMKQGEPLGDNRRVRVRDGVAVMEVIGPIFRHADFFSDISGATSTGILARDFGQAINSPGVSSVLIFIDSPGGEAFGISEFAKMINERQPDKPVVAYIGGYGASAAYYIGSAADEVVIDSSALIGSIGTVMEAWDYSKAYESRGIKKREYVSKQSPRKRPKMGTESGDAQLQEVVDDLAQIFVEDVARFRNVSVEKVLDDFGRGGLLVGEKAVAAGLADRVGSFESLLSEMASGKMMRKKKRMMKPAAETENPQPESGDGSGGKPMSFKDKFLAWLDSQSPDSSGSQDSTQAQAPAQQPAAQTATAHSAQPSAAAQPPQESDELKRLRADVDRERNARIASEAVAFADGEIAARRALPVEREGIVAIYTAAAQDDVAAPRQVSFIAGKETKQGTRVEALKATYAARPAHSLTRELVPFDQGSMQVLGNSAEDAEVKAAQESAKAYAERANGKK